MEFIKKHPIIFCLIVALVLRLFSVVFSKGYMASDDHFETVQVAWQGVQKGLLDEDGHLRWNDLAPTAINRSPLYNVGLYLNMKIMMWLGCESLDCAMYGIRLRHALISLIPVLFGMLYVRRATGDKRCVLLAGLILGAHFLMPYLSVRTLIEKVAEVMLVPSVFLAYVGVKDKNDKWLVLSGILGGLAWMIRFNTGICLVFMAPAIWYAAKNIRPMLAFCIGVAIMILVSGALDSYYYGRFAVSTTNLIHSALELQQTGGPLPQPFWIYIPLIFGIFVPPFSLYFILSFFRRELIREHIILLAAVASFVISHSLITHKEERYMASVFSLLTVMGTIGLWAWLKTASTIGWKYRLFTISAWIAVVLNIILLPIFTFNYAHKGMVEPFVYLSNRDDVRAVLVDRTERRRLLPVSYAGLVTPPIKTLDNWDIVTDFRGLVTLMRDVNYVIVYSDNFAEDHRRSLEAFLGPLETVFHSPPSTVDCLLHFMNPKHNHTNEAWIYKTTGVIQ
jgi:hypothetical protein